MTVQPFPGLRDLSDPHSLRTLLGPIDAIDRSRLHTGGFSAARHERLTVRLRGGEIRRLVLKRVRPASDWTAYRTGDIAGREAALLAEPALDPVWEVFDCPYLAFAVENGEMGLLLEDVGDYLLLDSTQPLMAPQEDAFLRSLAALHARFWGSSVLEFHWLAPLARRFSILGPGAAAEELRRPNPHPLFESVDRGWRLALSRLSQPVRTLLLTPADVIAQRYADLPATLVHGDAKIGNFAFLPTGRLAAFDWTGMGFGPATIDLGYYLAVSGVRLARPREQVVDHYRRFLARELHTSVSPELWNEMRSAAVLGGALMLLWSKALALESGAPGGEEEWGWWVHQLERLA